MIQTEYIIGISAYFHDSAACLLKDGQLVAAAQEERFTRVKHDQSYPENAVNYCLKEAGISKEDVTDVVFYEKPLLKFERILESYSSYAPYSFTPFFKAINSWLKEKLWIPSKLSKNFGKETNIQFVQHHASHAASTCFTSPFSSGAFIVLDGVGEWASTSIGSFEDGELNIDKEILYPNSIGLLYSAFTQYCGFKVNSGEYKLMGLAPYGNPKFKDLILKELIIIKEDLSYELNLDYFSFHKGVTMINSKFERLFGVPLRKVEELFDDHFKDVAASIQSVIEEYLLALVKQVSETYKTNNICLSGGVALNCSANGKIAQQLAHINLWIQPAAGDAGGALGAALLARKSSKTNLSFKHSYLGPSFNDEEIKSAFSQFDGLIYDRLDFPDLVESVASSLADKKVIGWFQDRMEWGPRALGNRSILASPAYADMKQFLNLKIKKREGFRPFAPVILEEELSHWFHSKRTSPFMMFTFDAKRKEEIPSCVHENNTARIQSVNAQQNKKLHSLIRSFNDKTGIPILINTSFNERGEPIVCKPVDAIKCFLNTGMDICVIGNYLVSKEKNTSFKWETITYEMD